MRQYTNKTLNLNRCNISIVLFINLMILFQVLSGQENNPQDTTKAEVSYNKSGGSFAADSGYVQTEALDIASDRGLFILSADKKMQMRILGSVRSAFNYTDQDLTNKSTLNPYEIPTDINSYSPNYYASLSQTRIGFEVTRKTKRYGDIFIRIETDFASQTNNLRLRHAYAQFRHILVGQTWSLFSNVNFQPATVSFDGDVGSVSLRTPQIRFFGAISKKFNWAAGIEYSYPDFIIPDSLQVSLLQVIPALTGQISFNKGIFNGQFAVIVATISGRDTTDKISYGFGVGGSLGGQFTIHQKNKIYLSFTSGLAISHYMAVFGGKREDAAYNPFTKKFESLIATSGFLAYGREFRHNISANLSAGVAAITNKDFQPNNSFSYGYNAMLNVFWQPIEGARLGIEFANGQRVDKGGNSGMANKISMLLYYDF